MTDLNDKTKRLELVHRYLNAETTLEEERLLLDYYTQAMNVLTPEEENVRIIIISTRLNTSDVELSDEKEAEFDKIMMDEKSTGKIHTRKKTSIVLWPTFLAAVVILTLILVSRERKETLVVRQYAKTMNMVPPNSPHKDKAEDKPQQTEKDTVCQMVVEEVEMPTHESQLLAVNNENLQLSTPVKEEGEANELPQETSLTEKPAKTTTETAIEDSKVGRYPMNVSVANYTEKKRNHLEYIPSGNASYATHSVSNANSAVYISLICYMELHNNSVIYKIDGEWVNREAVLQLPPESIIEMQILKRGTAAALMEDSAGLTNDIILITTQKSKNHNQSHSSIPLRNHPLMSESIIRNSLYLL